MRRAFQNRQEGTSMVELMIASALLAIVGGFAVSFFKRLGASDAEARARSGTIAEITTFLTTIERDFKLRPVPVVEGELMPRICPGTGTATCRDFSISRMVRLTDGKDGLMPVSFKSTCAVAPGAMKLKFDKDLSMQSNKSSTTYSDAQGSKSNALNGKCFATAACKDGEYAQLQITLAPPASAVVPSYPRLASGSRLIKFPDMANNTAVTSGVVGAVLCGESGGSSYSDRLVLEAAYVNSEGKMRIEKREISVPRRNFANIQMLPASIAP